MSLITSLSEAVSCVAQMSTDISKMLAEVKTIQKEVSNTLSEITTIRDEIILLKTQSETAAQAATETIDSIKSLSKRAIVQFETIEERINSHEEMCEAFVSDVEKAVIDDLEMSIKEESVPN